MPRPLLRDDKWERMTDVLPGKANDCEITAKNNRLYSEAVLWMRRRAVHGATGVTNWRTTYTRYWNWGKKGV